MFGTPTTADLAAMLNQMEQAPGAMVHLVPSVPIMTDPRLNTPWWEMWRDLYDDSIVLLVKPLTLPTPATLEVPATIPTILPTS